jgi:hypothetical protein
MRISGGGEESMSMGPVRWFLLSISIGSMLARGIGWAQEEPGWRPLFNGRDLEGWYTSLGTPQGGSAPIGIHRDPAGIFSVVDLEGRPAIRITGEIVGGIVTEEEFENFHLRVEWKWGDLKWPPRDTMVRDSGILYYCVGQPDGKSGWLPSIEYGILERGTADFWTIGGSIVDVEGEPNPDPVPSEGAMVRYKRGGRKFTVPSPENRGIAADQDHEKTPGEWNVSEPHLPPSPPREREHGPHPSAIAHRRPGSSSYTRQDPDPIGVCGDLLSKDRDPPYQADSAGIPGPDVDGVL